MSVTTASALNLEEALESGNENEGRVFASVRRELGISSFSIYGVRAADAGTAIVGEHTQTGPGGDRQESLFYVTAGHAVFTVDGEEIDAPAGSFVFVRDPEVKRSAVSKEDGTTLIGIGGRPGEPWRQSPGEAMGGFFKPYNDKDYEAAEAFARNVLADYPGNGLALYNLACAENLLGKSEAALEHLEEALAAAPSLIENARKDDDFASIRGNERFEALIA